MKSDNTKRFSDRVEDYVKYRPGYPGRIIDYLQKKYELHKDVHIADIGAGTGISSKLFLDAGYKVTGVEPNNAMREKAVALLVGYDKFDMVNGSAESTGLADKSIDIVIAGQAFHWFDRARTAVEFRRILKPGGVVVLIWNERLVDTDFENAYEELLISYGTDYTQVDHRKITDEDIATFFSPAIYELAIFPNQQVFDFAGLKGRLVSSSYVPAEGEPGFEDMLSALKILFDKYNKYGTVQVNYDTKVYSGQVVTC